MFHGQRGNTAFRITQPRSDLHSAPPGSAIMVQKPSSGANTPRRMPTLDRSGYRGSTAWSIPRVAKGKPRWCGRRRSGRCTRRRGASSMCRVSRLAPPREGRVSPVNNNRCTLPIDTGPPQSATNASAVASRHPSDTYDALVAFSGDGIVHELLNGLANHTSGKGRKVLRETPIVHVPCGSGNALATSLLGPDKVGDVRWAALAALKGTPLSHLTPLVELGKTYELHFPGGLGLRYSAPDRPRIVDAIERETHLHLPQPGLWPHGRSR